MQLEAEAHGLAYDVIPSARSRSIPGTTTRAAGLCRMPRPARAGRHDERVRSSKAIAAREPGNAPVRIELSRVLAAGGDFDGAIATATEALRLTPDDPRAGEQLASIVADAGDADRARGRWRNRWRRVFPDRPEPQYYRRVRAVSPWTN